MTNISTPEILVNKYQIIDTLGQGGVGITYRSRDIETDRIVAIKALSLKRARDWKAIELFDREAKILSQLNHPAIPQYIDSFQIDTEIDRNYYIVQNFVSLPSDFANWIDRLLEPEPTRRFRTAELALAILDGRSNLPTLPAQQPSGSKIRIDRSDEYLIIEIPPVKLSTLASRRLGLLVLVWNGLLFIIFFYSLTLSLFLDPAKQLFFIGFGVVGLWLMVKFLYGSLSLVTIYFDANKEVLVTKYLLNSKYSNVKLTNVSTAIAFALTPFARSLQLRGKGKKYSIAQLLSSAENNWLKSEIDNYIDN